MLDRRLRIAALVLTLIGVGVASYLTYVHYANVSPICNIAHGCETVQKSAYAKVAGVPVALIGLIGYVLILAALIVDGEYGRAGAALFALIGFGFSAYLTYREIWTIKAICQWCVSSAVILTLLAILTTVRFVNAPAAVTTRT